MRRNSNTPSPSPVETAFPSNDDPLSIGEIRTSLGAAWRTIESLGKRPMGAEERRDLELVRIKAAGLTRLAGEVLEAAEKAAAAPVAAGAPGNEPVGPGHETARSNLSGVRVLLCKPERSNHAAIGQMLRHLGAKVTISEGLADALNLRATQAFDAVILLLPDHPDMAAEALVRFRQIAGPHGEVPVLVVASVRARADLRRLEALGADAVLETPISDVCILGTALARALEPRPGVAPGADAETVAHLEALLFIAGPTPNAEILTQLERDISGTSEQLSEAVLARDPERTRRAAHVLVSLAGTAGAAALEALAREIDRLARRADSEPRIDALAREAERESEGVRACIGAILSGLGEPGSRSGR